MTTTSDPKKGDERVPGEDDIPMGSDGQGGVVVLTDEQWRRNAMERNAEEDTYMREEKAARAGGER